MEEQKKHWKDKVHCIKAKTADELVKQLGKFKEDYWVPATQIFPPETNPEDQWVAIVYYKIPPEEKEDEK